MRPSHLDTNGVYQPQLQISWPPLLGIAVSNYEVFVDGAGVPAGVTAGNTWTMTVPMAWPPAARIRFQLDYVTTDGTISPISPAASGATWSGGNYYGIPVEWLEQFYGDSIASWPANVNAPLAAGGLTLLQVFLSRWQPAWTRALGCDFAVQHRARHVLELEHAAWR